jgi:hypothetical protein
MSIIENKNFKLHYKNQKHSFQEVLSKENTPYAIVHESSDFNAQTKLRQRHRSQGEVLDAHGCKHLCSRESHINIHQWPYIRRRMKEAHYCRKCEYYTTNTDTAICYCCKFHLTFEFAKKTYI